MLQDLSKWNQEGKAERCYEEIGIVELKNLIAPFVHVHLIAPESLPCLRDCVLVLNPPYQTEMVFSSSNDKEDMVINKEVFSGDRILDKMVRSEKLKDMFEKIIYHPKES
ncbi:unnamed protein product [Cochlearia groenlandica]